MKPSHTDIATFNAGVLRANGELRHRVPPAMRQPKRGRPRAWSSACKRCGRSVLSSGNGSAVGAFCGDGL